MAPPIDPLVKISPEKESWRIKIRVVHLWFLPNFNNPAMTNSIEMVFMDEYGCKIHASVRKTLVYKFKSLLNEGDVYVCEFFGVGENSGAFRTTKHKYRLNFQYKTSVRPSDSVLIPLYGLSLLSLEDIFGSNGEMGILVDVIGLLSAVGTKREYDNYGKRTKMIVIELDVDSVKIECALFGSYVDDLTAFLVAGDVVQPVLIIQFAKVKTFKGKTILQNVMHATRILFNPNIPEVADFRKRLPLLGDEPSQALSHLSESPNISVEDDFLILTPRMYIEQLKDVKEEGFCIVLATAKHIIKGSNWWYTACKCNKAVTPDSGMYYCDSCYCHAVNVFLRYRIKLRVIDDSDCATFVLFDRDASYLLKRSCTEMLDLFQKVEIKCNTASQFEPSFRVRRVCDDVAIITKFMQSESAMTPKEAVMTEGVSVCEINIATDIPEVDSGVAKDLMSQFCDSETCLNSQPECVELNVCGDKRSAEEYSTNENADMSTTKFKQVKIEKD